jgi:hypothetical protein
MTANHNDESTVFVELTREQAQFVLDNCDANLEFGLKAIQGDFSQETVVKLVENMEKFKELRTAVRKAIP